VRRLNRIYHLGLYGHMGKLGYKLTTRADVGPLMALLPPAPMELVNHGPYVAFMAAGHVPKEEVKKRVEVVPFYYELEAHDGHSTHKVEWLTLLPGDTVPVQVTCELGRDPGRIEVRSATRTNVYQQEIRDGGYYTSTVVDDTVPDGLRRGSYINGGRWAKRDGATPRLYVYWTEEYVHPDLTARGWEAVADAMLDVTDDMMALAGRLSQDDPTTCYARRARTKHNVTRCENPASRVIVRRDDTLKARTICKDHEYEYTDHVKGDWLVISREGALGQCCSEVYTGQTCYQAKSGQRLVGSLMVDVCENHHEAVAAT
jgi:hypothetical protein